MYLIGHRGSSYDAPENTIAAAKLAWEEKADGIEIDVRMTADEQIVVIHDETTIRTSAQRFSVSKTTLEQLKKIDFGLTKNPKWAGEKIATLQEVLDATPAGKKLIIEYKCAPNAIEKLKETLKVSGRASDVAIACFDLQILKLIRKTFPDTKVYWLHDVSEIDSYLRDWIIEKSLKEGFNGFLLADSGIDEDLIELTKKAKLELFAWTVNSPILCRKFSKWGVDGVITDRPGWLKNQLKLLISL
jgi:glycerophosphoryl diester phosphodiesterase